MTLRTVLPFLLMSATTLPTTALAQEGVDATTTSYVKMTTTRGDIYIELYPDEAPVTVENFLTYVADGFYDGTIFHRVIPGFVIQGGGFTEDFSRKDTRAPIKNEADNGVRNARGTLSMARTAMVDSATSQFFVNLVDNAALDHTGKISSRAWGYAVFGKVVRGMMFVDQIAATPTGPAGPFRSDVPMEAMVIESAEIVDSLPPLSDDSDDETEEDTEAVETADTSDDSDG